MYSCSTVTTSPMVRLRYGSHLPYGLLEALLPREMIHFDPTVDLHVNKVVVQGF